MTDAVQKLADEAAIRNLVARLAHLADHAPDLVEYLTLWTDDGVYDVREPIGWKPGDPSQAKVVRGIKEMEQDRVMLRRTGFQGPGTDVWHANTTLWIKVNDDGTAEAESYWLLLHGHGKPELFRLGRYQDKFRKTADGWKICLRVITPNGSDGVPKKE
jgi:hypothetical protein